MTRFPTLGLVTFWVALAGANFYIFCKVSGLFQYIVAGMVVFCIYRAFRMLKIGQELNKEEENDRYDSETDA
jgi:hypothetical protein